MFSSVWFYVYLTATLLFLDVGESKDILLESSRVVGRM